MAKLKVKNLGREGISTTLIVPDEALKNPNMMAEEVYKDVKKYLISRDIEVIWDMEKKKGLIRAGLYKVGEFELAR